MYELKNKFLECYDESVWQYRVIKEVCYHVDLGEYSTYSIQVFGGGFEKILHDVSACKETAVMMAELFNRNQLSPVHLKEAVEDILV